METQTMGSVLVTAKLESLEDLFMVAQGRMADDQVRRVEVTDALVDTGATLLSLPKRLIDQLGLRPVGKRQARTTTGIATFQTFGTVRLTVQGRSCPLDVTEVPDDCPVLIGQIPLELLDFVVDPAGRCLIGNPRHGGQYMLDMF
jgi:predicted aspartyl protease